MHTSRCLDYWLFSAVLCCAVLCCAVLCRTVLCCSLLQFGRAFPPVPVPQPHPCSRPPPFRSPEQEPEIEDRARAIVRRARLEIKSGDYFAMAQRLADDILDPALDNMNAPPSSLRQGGKASSSSSSSSSRMGKLDNTDFHFTYAKYRVHRVVAKTVAWVEDLVQKLSPFGYLFGKEEEDRVRAFVGDWEDGSVGDDLGGFALIVCGEGMWGGLFTVLSAILWHSSALLCSALPCHAMLCHAPSWRTVRHITGTLLSPQTPTSAEPLIDLINQFLAARDAAFEVFDNIVTFPSGILEINTYEIKCAIAARAEELAVILLRSLSSLVLARCTSLSTRYSELQEELLQVRLGL